MDYFLIVRTNNVETQSEEALTMEDYKKALRAAGVIWSQSRG